MQIIKNILPMQEAAAKAKRKGKTIGFVPTMGALHEGHASLLKQCRKDNDISVLSIFVNPKQFGPQEDFANYPREEKKDCLLAKKEKVDIIFYPSMKAMYAEGYLTYIDVESLNSKLCGQFRPGHFKGVATIVGKLLNIVSPDILFLGQKDAQQCVVLQKMITDLNWPVKVKVMPTVREPDGLAMSSRNKYLTVQERLQAPILYKALLQAKKAVTQGERDATKIRYLIETLIRENSASHIDYVECVDSNTLLPLKTLSGKVLIAIAVKFGQARLIDNIVLNIS